MIHRWYAKLLFFFLSLSNQSPAFNLRPQDYAQIQIGNHNTTTQQQTHNTHNSRPQASGPSAREYEPAESYSDRLAAVYDAQAKQCEKEYQQHQKKLFESGASLNLNDQNYNQKMLATWNQDLLLAQNSNDSYRTTWLTRRIAALQKTIATKQVARYYGDEVNTKFTISKEHPQLCLYGTELDKVLYQELQTTQDVAYYLQDQFRSNIHARAVVPLIIEHIAQAKHERDIATAFSRADCAHDLLAIACHGIEENTKGALGLRRGITNAVKTVISPAHWKQMVIDMAYLIRFVAKEYAEFEMLEHAFDDPDHERRAKFYERYAHDHKVGPGDHIVTFIQNSYATFCDKTWEKKLESCAELFTTLALESVIIGAAIHRASASGRAIVSEAASIFKQGPTAIAEYGAEVAGVGRLVVQDGEAMVFDALKVIEKHPEKILKAKGSFAGALEKEVETTAKMSLSKRCISREKFFNFTQAQIDNMDRHIFSEYHVKKGIMNLGKDKLAIFELFKEIIYDLHIKDMLKPNLNQIHATINGYKIEIKAYLRPDGTVLNIDGFIGQSTRIFGHYIKLGS